MQDLITPARAAQNPALSQLAATSPGYLAALISAASDSIRRTCGRDFILSSYTEYYSGGIYIHEPLRLRQFPVTEITRVAASPTPALLVQNVDAITNQRATVETTPTGVRLVRVASAVATTNDLAYTSYPTITSMASAINALSNGWSATVRNGFDYWPSADFKPLQGAATSLAGGRDLELYTEQIQPFVGWPFAGDGPWSDAAEQSGAGWRLDDETGELYGRFPRGQLNVRIDYAAGFASIPQSIQEACVQLVQDLYQAGLVNNTLKKATLGASSVELKDQSTTPQMSAKVSLLIQPYVDYAKRIGR
jgi:hypothetical protein